MSKITEAEKETPKHQYGFHTDLEKHKKEIENDPVGFLRSPVLINGELKTEQVLEYFYRNLYEQSSTNKSNWEELSPYNPNHKIKEKEWSWRKREHNFPVKEKSYNLLAHLDSDKSEELAKFVSSATNAVLEEAEKNPYFKEKGYISSVMATLDMLYISKIHLEDAFLTLEEQGKVVPILENLYNLEEVNLFGTNNKYFEKEGKKGVFKRLEDISNNLFPNVSIYNKDLSEATEIDFSKYNNRNDKNHRTNAEKEMFVEYLFNLTKDLNKSVKQDRKGLFDKHGALFESIISTEEKVRNLTAYFYKETYNQLQKCADVLLFDSLKREAKGYHADTFVKVFEIQRQLKKLHYSTYEYIETLGVLGEKWVDNVTLDARKQKYNFLIDGAFDRVKEMTNWVSNEVLINKKQKYYKEIAKPVTEYVDLHKHLLKERLRDLGEAKGTVKRIRKSKFLKDIYDLDFYNNNQYSTLREKKEYELKNELTKNGRNNQHYFVVQNEHKKIANYLKELNYEIGKEIRLCKGYLKELEQGKEIDFKVFLKETKNKKNEHNHPISEFNIQFAAVEAEKYLEKLQEENKVVKKTSVRRKI